MEFPEQNSVEESICKWLMQFEPATARDIQEATGHSISSTTRAHKAGMLTRKPGEDYKAIYLYSVAEGVRNLLSMGGVSARYKGEIVPPRVVNVLHAKPLTGYTASLTANLRDMSFMRASSYSLASK